MDLAFIRKDEDGSVVGIDIRNLDLEGNPEIAVFEGASSRLIGDDDRAEAGNALGSGTTAAILLFENTWAGRDGVGRSGGSLSAPPRSSWAWI